MSNAGVIAPTNDENEVSTRHWIALFGGLIGAFMAILDIQITNSSLKDIQGALSATLDESSWISTSYLVAEMIACLIEKVRQAALKAFTTHDS